jgi:dipeptidyl aminopeptidase/acylaminoacyl peptidase
LADIDASEPTAIPDPGPHGEPFKDWLYLPPKLSPGHRPPLIVLGYPGAVYPEAPYVGRPGLAQFDDNPQLLAAHGYAVLMPSLPISTDQIGYGANLASKLGHAIDLAAKIGGFDPDRIAFWGHSAGGHMALELATQTNRFKAIIAAAATADLISLRGQPRPSLQLGPDWPLGVAFPQGWTELGQGHLMATPWTKLDRYVAASPVFAADKIATPILLVQGDQDVMGAGQAEEMFSALYRLRKDALLLTFYGEGHTISSPPNVRAYWKAAFDFLDLYLDPVKGER